MQTKITLISPKQHDLMIEAITARAQRMPNGLHDLPRDERVFCAVAVLNEAIINHGLEHFIGKHGKELLGDVLAGLDLIGAKQTQAVLLRAASLLHPIDCFDGGQGASSANEGEARDVRAEMAEFDDVLSDDPDRLGERLEEYAYRQNLIRITIE